MFVRQVPVGYHARTQQNYNLMIAIVESDPHGSILSDILHWELPWQDYLLC